MEQFSHCVTGEYGGAELESQWTAGERERLGVIQQFPHATLFESPSLRKERERLGHPPTLPVVLLLSRRIE